MVGTDKRHTPPKDKKERGRKRARGETKKGVRNGEGKVERQRKRKR